MGRLLLLGGGANSNAVVLSYLGHAENSANQTSYTFSSGYTMTAGKIIVCSGTRAASAINYTSVTVDGVTATLRKSDTNADGSGASRTGIHEVDLTSVSTQNIVVDWGATTSVRCGISVYKLVNAGSVYATASGIQDGTGVTLSTTLDTPAKGAAIAYTFMSNLNGDTRLCAASDLTTLQTALAISAGNGGAAGISYTGLTRDATSNAVIEAGASTGDGALVAVSWSPA